MDGNEKQIMPNYKPGTKEYSEALKEQFTKTDTYQNLVEGIGNKYTEVDVVKVIREMPNFVETHLSDLERLVFQKYYFHNCSIHDIKWTEPIDTYREVEMLLKSATKKFTAFCRKECR